MYRKALPFGILLETAPLINPAGPFSVARKRAGARPAPVSQSKPGKRVLDRSSPLPSV
jgi:hypothetical protein